MVSLVFTWVSIPHWPGTHQWIPVTLPVSAFSVMTLSFWKSLFYLPYLSVVEVKASQCTLVGAELPDAQSLIPDRALSLKKRCLAKFCGGHSYHLQQYPSFDSQTCYFMLLYINPRTLKEKTVLVDSVSLNPITQPLIWRVFPCCKVERGSFTHRATGRRRCPGVLQSPSARPMADFLSCRTELDELAWACEFDLCWRVTGATTEIKHTPGN